MGEEFKFLRVDNDKELLTETYRLRYEIYCKEKHFLNVNEYPDGIETDAYDNHSLHFAALNKEGDVIGTTRLVLNSYVGFPLEKHCSCLNIDNQSLPPRPYLAEISRLVVRKRYQRRTEVGRFGVEPCIIKKEKSKRPMIMLGLIKAAYQETKRRGITHWYAAMEKKLWYALKRCAFQLQPIGPEVDYYGPVKPYLGAFSEIEIKLNRSRPSVMEMLLEGLDYRYWPFGLYSQEPQKAA